MEPIRLVGGTPEPRKDKTVAALLAFLGGLFGLHKFYLGDPSAIYYAIFFWTGIPKLISLVQGVGYLLMSQADFDARYNSHLMGMPPQHLIGGLGVFHQSGSKNYLEKLETLNKLRQIGAITEEEFQREKAKILGQSQPSGSMPF